ncbi:SDR family oxidoreductase [Geminocystis sp. NIES-3709]|uniref:SDR family NAD(P)-dependent oxidoreductase n=1 Tax=Geminocystis sp. NIES-3709 TaxID=1617448 RepID=UPI0005FC5E12|nr:SDR family NAD(P)-dependent oxidoreductase [Geminocystis sp. NIES-3709]BAQ67131.1 3-oxoacyl-[acyl-carrier protein] reductase [Geminocystis sp. NIES-3709]
MKIQGKTALVTGASRGIGRAIAIELAQNGIQRLLLVARDATRLAQLATEIEVEGVEVVIIPLDLTKPIDVNIAVAKAWRDYGPIHLLVNCAGIVHQTPFLQSKMYQIHEEISLNLMGMYTITRLMARRMAARQEGTIVNVSSLMGKVAAPTMSTYSATKFAILGFTQALRGELSAHKLNVISLLPSLTDTDMSRGLKLFSWVRATTPKRVAISLLRGLHRGDSEILVGWQSYLAVWGQRLAPWLLEKILLITAPQWQEKPQLRG